MRAVPIVLLALLCFGCAAAPMTPPPVARVVSFAGHSFALHWHGPRVSVALPEGARAGDPREGALMVFAIEMLTRCTVNPDSRRWTKTAFTARIDCSRPAVLST